ncbi:MAG: GGDEF domain-containing protein [Candidatus Kerfeldbacteria bacterium]|nr:GGDEF domain-containing protein [Candidatus Kerfeldbacteria bacterium]
MMRGPDHQRLDHRQRRSTYIFQAYLHDHPRSRLGELSQDQHISEQDAFRILREAAADPKTGVQRPDLLLYALGFEMDEARAGRQRLSVAVFDIDNFKQINTELGHVTADDILRDVADSIDHTVRASDFVISTDVHEQADAVVRWGGEEFIALFPGATIEQGKIAADRIRLAISSRLMTRGIQGGPVTVSGGVAEFQPDRDQDQRALLQRADELLLKAKAAGKNQVMAE